MSKSNLKREIAHLKESRATLLEMTDVLKQANSALEEKTSKLQKEKDILDGRVSSLEKMVVVYNEEKDSLEKETSKLQKEKDVLNEKVFFLQNENFDDKKKIDCLEEAINTLRKKTTLQQEHLPEEVRPLFGGEGQLDSEKVISSKGAKTGSSSLPPSSSSHSDNIRSNDKYVPREIAKKDCPLCMHMSNNYGITPKSPIHAVGNDNSKKVLTESCSHIVGLDIKCRSDLLYKFEICRVCLAKPTSAHHKEMECRFLNKKQRLKCSICHLRLSVCSEHSQDNLEALNIFKQRFSDYGFDFHF